jgi:hypothetical protein
LIYIDEYQTLKIYESTLSKFKSHFVKKSEFRNASFTNDRFQNVSSVNDSFVKASIANDSVRAFRSQEIFLQKSSQILSHIDTTSRIMMLSNSLNEKNKDSDINNETNDEEDNSIIVFKKNDDRNKNRFL